MTYIIYAFSSPSYLFLGNIILGPQTLTSYLYPLPISTLTYPPLARDSIRSVQSIQLPLSLLSTLPTSSSISLGNLLILFNLLIGWGGLWSSLLAHPYQSST